MLDVGAAVLDEELRHGLVAGATRDDERRCQVAPARHVGDHFDIGLGRARDYHPGQQQLYRVDGAVICRDVYRSFAARRQCKRIGARAKERDGDVCVPVRDGDVQRSHHVAEAAAVAIDSISSS